MLIGLNCHDAAANWFAACCDDQFYRGTWLDRQTILERDLPCLCHDSLPAGRNSKVCTRNPRRDEDTGDVLNVFDEC